MTTNKKFVSTRISEEDYGLIQIICKREKLNPYELLAKLIKKETDKVRGTNPEVFPTIGENKFDYIPDSDSFVWKIDFGSGNSIVISEKLSSFFVDNLLSSIQNGLKKRIAILKKLKKDKAYIPEAILNFREK